jgi:YidC/Oxa1 family membrane protein insertase
MMQAIQPEMMKIREKYQKDQQKLQQETMKLFSKHNVNPFASCLPILVQMPILLAFYHAIWRHDVIPNYEFFGIALGAPFWGLAILSGITTYTQQKMMGMQANPQMKILLVIMPIMITIFGFYFPAALTLYWVIGNLFTIVQTYFMKDMYKLKQEVASK